MIRAVINQLSTGPKKYTLYFIFSADRHLQTLYSDNGILFWLLNRLSTFYFYTCIVAEIINSVVITSIAFLCWKHWCYCYVVTKMSFAVLDSIAKWKCGWCVTQWCNVWQCECHCTSCRCSQSQWHIIYIDCSWRWCTYAPKCKFGQLITWLI